MLVIIQPARPLAPIDGNRAAPGYAQRLLASRRAQLEQLRNTLLNAFPVLRVASGDAGQGVEVLPANGELIVDAPEAVIEALRSTPWLQAYPDYILPPLEVFVFPAMVGTSWHLASIRKPAAFDGTGIVAGVVDSGINLAFPDHASRSPHLGFGAFDGATGLVRAAAPIDLDSQSHGSLVCAFLAGKSSGVSPAVQLNVAAIPPIFDANTGVRIHRGLEWLSTHANPGFAREIGSDVVNLSVHIGWENEWVLDLYQPLMDLRDQFGTFVVAAIGNAMGCWTCPGAYDCVCAVGAVTSHNDVAAFSSWGSNPGGMARPDLIAPGSDVSVSTASGITTFSGTSFSSPIVAGAACLIMQKYPTERLRPDLIRQRILSLVRKIGSAECCPSATAAQLAVMTGAGTLDLKTI